MALKVCSCPCFKKFSSGYTCCSLKSFDYSSYDGLNKVQGFEMWGLVLRARSASLERVTEFLFCIGPAKKEDGTT